MTWADRAACRGMDTDVFFPEHGGFTKEGRALVESACGVCPVRGPCLAEALANPDTKGIWAGTTDRDRKRLRRARARNQPFQSGVSGVSPVEMRDRSLAWIGTTDR